jgi:hypothetical protein
MANVHTHMLCTCGGVLGLVVVVVVVGEALGADTGLCNGDI